MVHLAHAIKHKNDIDLSVLLGAIDSVAIGILIGDEQGRILHWNTAALTLLDLSAEEAHRDFSEIRSKFTLTDLDGNQFATQNSPLQVLSRGDDFPPTEIGLHQRDTQKFLRIVLTASWFTFQSRRLFLLNLQDVTKERQSALEMRQAQAALRDNELRLRGVVDTAVDGIITFDAARTIESVNPAVSRIFGYQPGQMIGQNLNLLMPDLQWNDPRFYHLETSEGRNLAQGHEADGRRCDAATISLELSIAEINLGDRRLYTGTIRDISARKEADRRILNKQALLRTLVEGITDPVYIKTAQGKYRFVNTAVAKLTGRSVEQCIDVSMTEIYGQELGRLSVEADKRVLESSEPVTYEDSARFGDDKRYYLVTKCRYLEADGKVGGLIGISRDITSQKLAENALRESEMHLREVMDCVPLIVLVLDTAGNIREANRTAVHLFRAWSDAGWTTVGQRFDLLPWISEPAAAEAIAKAIKRAAGGETVRVNNVAMRHRGDISIHEIAVAPMHDADGRVTHLILSAADITEQRIAEEKTREQQADLAHLERVQTMGHMAGGLAHELNQPLASIVNYASACRSLIASGKGDIHRLDNAFAEVISEASRAGEIIRRLRGFVQKQRPAAVEICPNTLVLDAVRILAFEIRQAGVIVEQKLSSPLPLVLADPIQISQVLVNLLRNAIDAMQEINPASRHLQLQTDMPAADAVRVSVHDNGKGVRPEDLARLFDAFYTTKKDGMGIGLALCRMIIENHGGQLTAQIDPSGGMIFAFTLKIASQKQSG